MKLRLRSIEHAPRALPIWQTILDDLGDPPPHRVARALGVSVRTVYRWNAAQQAPRCAALALFWLTRWGHSQVHAEAVRNAQLACAYANTLERELTEARAQIARLGTTEPQIEARP